MHNGQGLIQSESSYVKIILLYNIFLHHQNVFCILPQAVAEANGFTRKQP